MLRFFKKKKNEVCYGDLLSLPKNPFIGVAAKNITIYLQGQYCYFIFYYYRMSFFLLHIL